MSNVIGKLDQAFKDLVEAFAELESQCFEKYENDEENYNSTIVEAIETCIEGALDECDVDTSVVATLLTACSEALENIDPEAFSEQDGDDDDYASDDDEEEDEDDEDLEDYDEDLEDEE